MMGDLKMFKKFEKLETQHKTIYGIFVGFAVIAFWRGTWGLLDYYTGILLPGRPLLSFWVMVLLGLTVLITTHYVTEALI